jgi:hypothetical protein
MNAGSPGAGVGGLFLILSALLMPLVELHRTVRRRSSLARWRAVISHAAVAVGMVAVVAGAIGIVRWAFFSSSSGAGRAGARGGAGADATHLALPMTPLLMTLAVLATILVSSYMLPLLLARLVRPDQAAVNSDPPAIRARR